MSTTTEKVIKCNNILINMLPFIEILEGSFFIPPLHFPFRTHFVHGGDPVPTHGRDVAPRQHGVVHPAVHRQLLGEHCLAGAGRAVEELRRTA